LGAQAIVFDIQFPEADRSSPAMLAQDPALRLLVAPGSASQLRDYDKTFATAMATAPVVVAAAGSKEALAAVPMAKAGFAATGLLPIAGLPEIKSLVSNLPQLNDAAKGLGLISLDLASDGGITRTLPLLWRKGDATYPSLALEALRVAQNEQTIVINGSNTLAGTVNSLRVGTLEIPTSEQATLALYYHKDDPGLYISAHQVLDTAQQENLRALVKGHIVFIGATATGLLDTRISSLGEALPGVAVHAQAVEQILSGQFLSRPEWITSLELASVAISGVMLSLAAALMRPLRLFALFGLLACGLAALSLLAFLNEGLLLDFTFPIAATSMILLATLAFKLLVTEREGRALRSAFGHYVAAPVLAQIEENPAALALGGEQREVTVMFADIKNFTPLTEKLPPEELVPLVNRVLETCTKAILAENGTLDKYIGDAVMAFWNAPVTVPDHQYHAARAALKIQHDLAALNADKTFAKPLKEKGLWPIGLRIGLASGPATVGNMGSQERFDYSVLGETVNTAARAEAACKDVRADILLAGHIIGKTNELSTLDAGKCLFKGATQRKQCFAIFGQQKDEEHRLADMSLHGFQSGTRTLQATHDEAYRTFLDGLPQRRQDYGFK
jgi:adenylate cyclase